MRASTAQFTASIATTESTPVRQVLCTWPARLNPVLARTNECVSPSATHGVGWWTGETPGGSTMSTGAATTALPDSGNATAFLGTWANGPAGQSQFVLRGNETQVGHTFTFQMLVLGASGGPAIRLFAVIGKTTVYGTPVPANGAWQRATVQFTASRPVTVAGLATANTTTGNPAVQWGDCIMEDVTMAGALGPFFDGDGALCGWESYLGGSASVQQQAPYNDVTKAVTSYNGQAALTTDMPISTRLVEGYPSRTTTIQLAGRLAETVNETVTAPFLFDDLSSASPLYRLEWTGLNGLTITINQGLQSPVAANGTATGQEMFSVITATVDNCAISRAAGTVTLTLRDDRFRLSETPDMPAAIAVLPWLPGQAVNPICAPGLTAMWALDYALRASGIYSAPPPRPGCVAYLSMHGSLWPEVSGALRPANFQLYGSWSGTTQPAQPAWQPGRNVGQTPVAGTAIVPLTTSETLDAVTNTGFTIEGWVFNSGGAGNSVHASMEWAADPTQAQLMLNVLSFTNGNLFVTTTSARGGGSQSTTAGFLTGGFGPGGLAPGWHQVSAVYGFPDAATTVCRYYIDGKFAAAETVSNQIQAQLPVTQLNLVIAGQAGQFGAETWQVFTDAAQTPTPSLPAGAVLDASLNNLTAVPDAASDADAWQAIQQICDAEGAIAGFDEDNIFRFRNRLSKYGSASQAVITSLTQVKDLAFERNEANRARAVQANALPLAAKSTTVVWAATETYVVQPHRKLNIFAELAAPTLFVPTQFQKIPLGGLVDYTQNGYRAAYSADGRAGPVSSVVFLTAVLSATLVLITIRNDHPQPIYLVSASGDGPPTSDGQPSISLVGTVIAPAGSVDSQGNQTGQVAVQTVWPVGANAPVETANPSRRQQRLATAVLSLPDNPWCQDSASLQQFTSRTLEDLYRPRPVLTSFVIVGDPRLQLGDRVTVQDQGRYVDGGYGPGAVLNDDVILTQINPSAGSGEGFTQTCIGRFATRPGSWVLGVAGRSEMGQTTYV